MKFTNLNLPEFWGKWKRVAFLALFWVLGLLLSIRIFSSQQAMFSSLMRSASFNTVSIVGLFTIVIVPFSTTAFAVIYSKPYILYMLCFAKSTLYSFCVLSIYSLYGSAGWLAQLVLLFAENVSVIMLWFLWSNNFTGRRVFAMKSLVICASVCTFLWILDYRSVSQFAVSVFSR